MKKKEVDSPAVHFLDHCWLHTSGRSWEQINHIMSATLKMAIESGMKFKPNDFNVIGGTDGPDISPTIAKFAYELADAMLKEAQQ